MKKMFFIILTFVAVGLINSSCSKSKTCKCEDYHHGSADGDSYWNTEEENVKNCSELQDKLNTIYGTNGWSFICKKI